jgi:hypothetical protein
MAVKIKRKAKKVPDGGKVLEHVIGHPVTSQVSKKHKEGGAEQVVNEEGFVVVTKPMSYVTMRAGKTTNLGNYESVKFEVSLTQPCEKGEEDDAFITTKAWVDKKLSALVEELEAAIVQKSAPGG